MKTAGIGLGIIGLGVLAYSGAALADAACGVAAHLVHSEAALPRVADSIAKSKTFKIVVVGTTSSTLPGANGQSLAYPARLEAALQKRLPGVNVRLISLAKPRQTAADMAEGFPKLLRDEKPALVIWQTGTYDAMRGIGAESFQATLEGEFSFTGKSVAEEEVTTDVTLPAITLLMESVRLQDELPLLKQRLPDPDHAYRQKAAQLAWTDNETSELAAAVWSRLKKGASMNELQQTVPRCSYSVYKTMLSLIDSAQIE